MTGGCAACGAPLPEAPVLVARDLVHLVPGAFEIRQCAECGSGTTFPRVSEAELGAFYPDEYAPFDMPRGPVAELMHRMQLARNRRFPVSGLGVPGHLLDVGCGRGDLGASLIEGGWRVTGIEPSPEAAAVARARGLTVHEGTLGTVPLPAEEFDAAVFRHSLEHVIDPGEELRRVHRVLRPGGSVAIVLPNWGSWQRRRFGERWFPLELPRHRTHFTATGLERALSGAGYEAVDVRPGTPLITTAWSLQLRLFGRLLTEAGPGLLAGYLASLPLVAVVRPIDLLTRSGDFLHALARKREQHAATSAPSTF